MTQAERIAALEVQVASMEKTIEAHVAEQHKINEKLDLLLAYKNKGVGAFWLATTLSGIGAFSIFAQILDWFRS